MKRVTGAIAAVVVSAIVVGSGTAQVGPRWLAREAPDGPLGALTAEAGETVRLFVGNGGPNLISSFHVIGEVFDRVYPEGGMGGELRRNIQTTLVPAGGAAIVEFKVDMPGRFLMVDHSISHAMDKGALGAIVVTGAERPDVFRSLTPGVANRPSGH